MGNKMSQIPSSPVLNYGHSGSEDKSGAGDNVKKEDVLQNCTTVLKTLTVAVSFIASLSIPLLIIPTMVISTKEASGFLINYLEGRQSLENLFIEAAIEKSQYQFALSLLNSELTAISNRRNRIFNRYVPVADKQIEVVSALHSCEKLFALFIDESFPFWKIPIEASKYFHAFTAVYLEILTLTLCVLPSYQSDAICILERILCGIEKFSAHCVSTRLSFIRVSYHMLPKIIFTRHELRDMKTFLEQKKRWWLKYENTFVLEFADSFPSVENPENPQDLVPWRYVTIRDPGIPMLTKLEAFLVYIDSCEKLYSDQFLPLEETAREIVNCLSELPDSTKSVKSAIQIFEKKSQ